MPSFLRTIFLALHASAFVALSGISPCAIRGLAAPIPAPLPLMAADYTKSLGDVPPPPNSSQSFKYNITEVSPSYVPRTVIFDDTKRSGSSLTERQDFFGVLQDYSSGASDNARNLKSMAASAQENDPEAGKDFARELSAFQGNFKGFHDTLATHGAGLGNYDRANDLETLMKNIVNCNKDVLKAVDDFVFKIPMAGPLLGPIVYQIKCLIELVLNICEEATDAILNALQPILVMLLGHACKQRLPLLLGFCI